MSTYRVEWHCCGSVTETESWQPESCPFCAPQSQPLKDQLHPNMTPPATRRDMWMYNQGRLAQQRIDTEPLVAALRVARDTLSVYADAYNRYWEPGKDILEPEADAAFTTIDSALALSQTNNKVGN